MAEQGIVEIQRVITLKGTQKPPLEKPYYGEDIKLPDGRVLKTVRLRRRAILSDSRSDRHAVDMPDWYELPMMDNEGNSRPMILKILGEPTQIFDDCLYPVLVWNITLGRRDEVHVIPFWKLYEYRDYKTGEPIQVQSPTSGMIVNLQCFHYVVENNDYVPNVLPDGRNDDGKFTQDQPPVIGTWIREDLESRKLRGRRPLAYRKA